MPFSHVFFSALSLHFGSTVITLVDKTTICTSKIKNLWSYKFLKCNAPFFSGRRKYIVLTLDVDSPKEHWPIVDGSFQTNWSSIGRPEHKESRREWCEWKTDEEYKINLFVRKIYSFFKSSRKNQNTNLHPQKIRSNLCTTTTLRTKK